MASHNLGVSGSKPIIWIIGKTLRTSIFSAQKLIFNLRWTWIRKVNPLWKVKQISKFHSPLNRRTFKASCLIELIFIQFSDKCIYFSLRNISGRIPKLEFEFYLSERKWHQVQDEEKRFSNSCKLEKSSVVFWWQTYYQRHCRKIEILR